VKLVSTGFFGLGLILVGCGDNALQTLPLTIESGKARHQFQVEIARTQDEQDRGLMFRKSVPPDSGMIFPLVPVCEARFWMKDTAVPLDMVFIRSDGTIARIEAETMPWSKIPITSGEPVASVLEIAGGRAEQLGIHEGDQVIWDSSQTVSARSTCTVRDR
jgi:uncharacterized membrane protein (UPF0127 family)